MPEDDDEICGCSGAEFRKGPTSDENLNFVALTGGTYDVDEVEKKIHEYQELFPNG